jgi:hypothetical protein
LPGDADDPWVQALFSELDEEERLARAQSLADLALRVWGPLEVAKGTKPKTPKNPKPSKSPTAKLEPSSPKKAPKTSETP